MKDLTFLKIAHTISTESKCVSHQVGAIIVKDDRIVSTGYNGTPSGMINCCDHARNEGWVEPKYSPIHPHDNIIKLNQDYRQNHVEWSRKNEIHAEINAIVFAAKFGISIQGATMYTTISPCIECSKAIIQSGIKRLVCSAEYDRAEKDWKGFISGSGIQVEILEIPKAQVLFNIHNSTNLDSIDMIGKLGRHKQTFKQG